MGLFVFLQLVPKIVETLLRAVAIFRFVRPVVFPTPPQFECCFATRTLSKTWATALNGRMEVLREEAILTIQEWVFCKCLNNFAVANVIHENLWPYFSTNFLCTPKEKNVTRHVRSRFQLPLPSLLLFSCQQILRD